MPKQRFLPFCGHEVLEDLWESLPEPNRKELVSLLAQRIEQAIRTTDCPGPLEVRHESDPR
jgi:hypothetical protein